MDLEKILTRIVEKVLKSNNQILLKRIDRMVEDKTNMHKGLIHEKDYFISKQTAAEMLDCSEAQINKMIGRKELSKYYFNGKASIRLKKSEVLALMVTETGEKVRVLRPEKNVKRGRAFMK